MWQEPETGADQEEELLEAEEEPAPDEAQPGGLSLGSLQVTKADWTVWHLHRRWKEKDLRVNAEIQQELAWDDQRKAKLIESVLMRIPLPAFYLSEEREGETIIIDGQQRLSTLFSFMEGAFELRGLRLLPELNRCRFAELDGKAQRRFENTILTCFVIQPGTNADIKFQLFERLNEAAISLNAQEIRSTLFRGPGLDLVRRLGGDTSPGSFRDVAGAHRKYRRMRAEELVLRALSFLDLGVGAYPGDMKGFLNEEIQRLNRAPASHAALERRLRDALARTKAVFGEHAFRRYLPEEQRWAPRLNAPLVEVIVTGFDARFPGDIPLPVEACEAIRDRFQRLCAHDGFRDALVHATQSEASVRRRFELWMREIADVA